MGNEIAMAAENFEPVHTDCRIVEMDGKTVLRVTKKEKIHSYDQNTYAKLKGIQFHNGVIELKLRSCLLPDAPDFARGFIGIVFRANEDNSEFESFYVRPTNGRGCTDPIRKAHGCQYFSYPGYTFDYFREFGITEFEAPVDVALGEWFTLKAVIENGRGEFYLNQKNTPVLVIDNMKHGANAIGSLGIFVDIGTEAFVSDWKVTCAD